MSGRSPVSLRPSDLRAAQRASLTSWRNVGYFPEKDATGKEVWPIGDEKVWKAGMRGVDAGQYLATAEAHILTLFIPL